MDYLTYPLPDSLIEVLFAMVDVALETNTLDVNYYENPSAEEQSAFDITFLQGGTKRTINNQVGSPIVALQHAGFISALGKENIFLRPAAFERVRYERRWRLSRWWERVWKSGNIMSVVSLIISFLAFLISVIVGLSSTIVEFLQIYGYLPKP